MRTAEKRGIFCGSIRNIILFSIAVLINLLLALYLSSTGSREQVNISRPIRALPVNIIRPKPKPEKPIEKIADKQEKAEMAPPILPGPKTIPLPPLQKNLPADTIFYSAESEGSLFIPTPTFDSISTDDIIQKVENGLNLSRSALIIRPPDLSLYYPYRAKIQELTGRSVLRLQLDEKGRIINAQIVTSSPDNIFDKAALRVARALHFHPALEDGSPVPSVTEISLSWRLEP